MAARRPPSRFRRGLPLVVGGAVVLAAVWFVVDVATDDAQPKKQVTITKVTLPPPPPPPPPPKVEPPPPPPEKVVEEKLKEPEKPKEIDKPEPPKVQAPPGSPLTGDLGTGDNPYGLQVGSGGGNVIGGGGGGGDGLAGSHRTFALAVARQLEQALREDEETRVGTYGLVLMVWIDQAGRIERWRIVQASDDEKRDAAVARLLRGKQIEASVPQGLPQPVRLKIGARAPA